MSHKNDGSERDRMLSQTGKSGDNAGNNKSERKKLVVAVRKKTAAKVRLTKRASSGRGLPPIRPSVDAPNPPLPSSTQKVQRGDDDKAASASIFSLPHEEETLLFQSLPSDTLLVMQTLQSDPESCLQIPLLHGHTIKGVLECQMQKRLTHHQTAHVELHRALADADLIKLQTARSLSGNRDDLEVFVTIQDYSLGVRDAVELKKDGDEALAERSHLCAEWLIRQLKSFQSTSRIELTDFQHMLAEDRVPGVSSSQLIDNLQALQLLLPSHHYNSYQLWLPGWGTVVRAWGVARTKMLAHLKRSYHKERSYKALRRSQGPIPASVLIEWLLSQGLVREIGPSGAFLKLDAV